MTWSIFQFDKSCSFQHCQDYPGVSLRLRLRQVLLAIFLQRALHGRDADRVVRHRAHLGSLRTPERSHRLHRLGQRGRQALELQIWVCSAATFKPKLGFLRWVKWRVWKPMIYKIAKLSFANIQVSAIIISCSKVGNESVENIVVRTMAWRQISLKEASSFGDSLRMKLKSKLFLPTCHRNFVCFCRRWRHRVRLLEDSHRNGRNGGWASKALGRTKTLVEPSL